MINWYRGTKGQLLALKWDQLYVAINSPEHLWDQAEACLQWGPQPCLAPSSPQISPSLFLLPRLSFKTSCAFEFLLRLCF